MKRQEKLRKILSIDGGGIRGILPLHILEAIKKELEKRGETKPLSHYFDLLAGTSTGALIILGLTCSTTNMKSPLTLESLINIYEGKSESIFSKLTGLNYKNFWYRFFLPPKEPTDYDKKLKEIFQDETLSDLEGNVFIPSLNIRDYVPYYFETQGPNAPDNKDFYIRDVARSATTDPLLFPIKPIRPVGLKHVHCFADGGFFAENPALLAYDKALSLFPRSENVFLLSLGTGITAYDNGCFEASKWSMKDWINNGNESPLLNSFFEGQIKSTQALLSNIDMVKYIRLEPYILKSQSATLDNSQKNIDGLKKVAKEYISMHRMQIEETVNWMLKE